MFQFTFVVVDDESGILCEVGWTSVSLKPHHCSQQQYQ